MRAYSADWSSREQYTLISISGFRLWRVNGQCNEYGYIIKCIYNTFGHFIDLPRLHAGFFYWWTGNRRWWRPPGRCSSSPSCQTDPRAARRPFLPFSAIGRNNLALVYIYMIRSVNILRKYCLKLLNHIADCVIYKDCYAVIMINWVTYDFLIDILWLLI